MRAAGPLRRAGVGVGARDARGWQGGARRACGRQGRSSPPAAPGQLARAAGHEAGKRALAAPRLPPRADVTWQRGAGGPAPRGWRGVEAAGVADQWTAVRAEKFGGNSSDGPRFHVALLSLGGESEGAQRGPGAGNRRARPGAGVMIAAARSRRVDSLPEGNALSLVASGFAADNRVNVRLNPRRDYTHVHTSTRPPTSAVPLRVHRGSK